MTATTQQQYPHWHASAGGENLAAYPTTPSVLVGYAAIVVADLRIRVGRQRAKLGDWGEARECRDERHCAAGAWRIWTEDRARNAAARSA